jgi:rRNA maturation protein Nop10
MKKMRFCNACQSYTLSEYHCEQTVSAHPAKFNPNDPYGEYRRRSKFGG